MELIAWGARSYEQPIATQNMDFTVNALASKVVKTVALNPLLANESLTLRDAVVRLSTTAQGNPAGTAISITACMISKYGTSYKGRSLH